MPIAPNQSKRQPAWKLSPGSPRAARSGDVRLSIGAPANAGLRREEIAQRANVSATWYTWLEQGRGGAPSADVLERIARALVLTEVEREHLFCWPWAARPRCVITRRRT